MENTDGSVQDHPIPSNYRHISVEDRDGVLVVRFIDLRRELGNTVSCQETYQEFRMLASHHHKCLVVLDLEGQEVSATEVFFCYLVRLDREVKQVQGTLKLCNLSPLVAEDMRTIRLNWMFRTYNSLDDALASDVTELG